MRGDTGFLLHPLNGTPWCAQCAPIGILSDGKTHVLPNLGSGSIIDTECTGVDDVTFSLWAWEDCYAMKPRKRIRKADAKIRIKEIWSLGTEERGRPIDADTLHSFLRRFLPYLLTFRCDSRGSVGHLATERTLRDWVMEWEDEIPDD